MAEWMGFKIVELAAVPSDEVWVVQPALGPWDKRSDAERMTRIVNVRLPSHPLTHERG